MRKSLIVLVAAMAVAMTAPAFAELQNVQVGGELRIRGNWYSEAGLSFDDDLQPDTLYFEQRTKVNVKADFTDDVSAFIELDSYNLFGDDFRGLERADAAYSAPIARGVAASSDTFGVLTGVDNNDGTPVSFYQGYIQMDDAWGYPLSFRIGRSEMQHGSEFLVGNNDTASLYRGLSFDGVWGTYTHDQFNLTAFWTRLVTNNNPFRFEESGDVNFSGIYASYTGLEDMVIDGYYYYYHQALTDPLAGFGATDAYKFHTIGARFAGSKAQFDWEMNAAYQTGDTGIPGVDISAWGLQGALGYTFDSEYQPRVFVQGVYLSGDDEDAPFNRLFSDHEYSEFLANTDLTNVWLVGGGASAQVTESINLSAVANYFQVVEDFGAPDKALGVELGIYATYDYSEDLYFSAGYAHFFALDGVESEQFVTAAGLGSIGGAGQTDDIDYVFIETGISF
jgi:hypothetical protein